MLLSEILDSKTLFDMNLMRPTNSPVLPPSPSTYEATTTEYSLKRSLVEYDSDCSQPPAKMMRYNSTFDRVPCKARGVSEKHNPITAFIDIPVDAPHGLLLSCSNIECVESGRKFRYCKICAHPVAKRNFPKRHGHGLIESSIDLKELDCKYNSILVNSSDEDTSCQPCNPLTAMPQSPRTGDCEKPSLRNRIISFDVPNQMTASGQQDASPASSSLTIKTELELNLNEKEWLSLLKTRPNLEDHVEMSAWMEKIITFTPEPFSSKKNSRDQLTRIVPATPTHTRECNSQMTRSLTPEQVDADEFFPLVASSVSPGKIVTDNHHAISLNIERRSSIEALDAVLANVDIATFFDF